MPGKRRCASCDCNAMKTSDTNAGCFISQLRQRSAHTARTQHRIRSKDTSLSRHTDMGLGWNRRRHSLQERAPPHFRKHEDVEEMHRAKHQHDDSNLATDRFEHFAKICGSDALLQRQRHVADIDEIKANDEKVIDRIRQPFVAAKRIDQKNAPVLCSVLRYPDGERNAQCDVNNVCPNYWCHRSFLSLVLFSMRPVFWFQKLQGPRHHLALL
jgi:hypothetical protein